MYSPYIPTIYLCSPHNTPQKLQGSLSRVPAKAPRLYWDPLAGSRSEDGVELRQRPAGPSPLLLDPFESKVATHRVLNVSIVIGNRKYGFG